MRSEDNYPDPELVNPERYVAAISAFQGRDVELGLKDVNMLIGEDMEDELDDLVEYGLLSRSNRGGKTVYSPRDDYAQKLSEECKNKISLVYNNAREMLEEDGSEGIIEILEYEPSVAF